MLGMLSDFQGAREAWSHFKRLGTSEHKEKFMNPSWDMGA
eukprot:CAMPEP_0173439222 /NCGR_PEP_ID=MMETSP1357-20121228/20836_1 /TAXON_ID=77926 /ORGANISM="Hemiselmis rufescens, Strain PCC563" /LENGTH=39 /DNA_ID= /DNA_START= /DNA_END= /DNA_ORIENTATION=